MKQMIVSILAAAALVACSGKSKSGGTGPGTGHGSDSGSDNASAPDAAVSEMPVDAPAVDPKVALLAAERDAYQATKPVFATYCANCHDQAGKGASKKTLAHLDITSYPFGGHHVATMGPTIKHVLGIDGAKPIMPKNKPGSVKGDELALISAWADAWQAADDGGAHPAVDNDHDHDSSVDEH